MLKENTDRVKSVHGTCNIFSDEEIFQVHPVMRRELFGKRFNILNGFQITDL